MLANYIYIIDTNKDKPNMKTTKWSKAKSMWTQTQIWPFYSKGIYSKFQMILFERKSLRAANLWGKINSLWITLRNVTLSYCKHKSYFTDNDHTSLCNDSTIALYGYHKILNVTKGRAISQDTNYRSFYIYFRDTNTLF